MLRDVGPHILLQSREFFAVNIAFYYGNNYNIYDLAQLCSPLSRFIMLVSFTESRY